MKLTKIAKIILILSISFLVNCAGDVYSTDDEVGYNKNRFGSTQIDSSDNFVAMTALTPTPSGTVTWDGSKTNNTGFITSTTINEKEYIGIAIKTDANFTLKIYFENTTNLDLTDASNGPVVLNYASNTNNAKVYISDGTNRYSWSAGNISLAFTESDGGGGENGVSITASGGTIAIGGNTLSAFSTVVLPVK